MPELAAIHNSMALQDQHCLREADDDGSEGDVRALASCRAFILAEVSAALGETDELDLDATELVAVGLWHAHQQVPLSRFAFHLGRGAHALQDSFSHGVRAKKQVQTLFNYVEPRLSSYAPARTAPRRSTSRTPSIIASVHASAPAASKGTAAARASDSTVGAGGSAPPGQRAFAVAPRVMRSWQPCCTTEPKVNANAGPGSTTREMIRARRFMQPP